MKTNAIIAFIVSILMLDSQAAVRAAVFNVKSSPYNATGNGLSNDWSALNNAIQDAISAGPGSIVEIPGGTNVYYLGTSISLYINNASGLTVQGDAPSTLLINGTTADVFHVYNSSNIVFKNIAIDTQPLRFTQGVVNSLAGDGLSMTVTLDSGFKPLSDSMFTNHAVQQLYYWTDPNCLAFDRNLPVNNYAGATLISGNQWTINLNSSLSTNVVGKKFAVWNDYGGWAMNLSDNTGPISVTDFAYYGGGAGACIGMYRNRGPINLTRVTVGPPPGSGRMISASGSFDSQGNRGALTMDGCKVSLTQEDTLDIGTDLAHILSTNSSTQIVVENTELYEVGDTVQIWDWTYGQQHVRDTATVTAATLSGGNWTLTLNHAVQILHAGAGPGDANWSAQEADGIDRCISIQNAAPGTVIKNCNFQTSGRTFNLKAADCTISNNVFYQTPWNIFCAAETFWHGGPAPGNLKIVNNTFNDVDIAPIEVEVRYSTSPASCSNILIAGNTFINCGAHKPFADGVYGPQVDIRGAGVSLRNVNVATVTNNTFYGIWGPPVVLENCTNINVVGNSMINCHQHYWSDWNQYQCDMGADIYLANSSSVLISGNVTYNEGTNLSAYISSTNGFNITGLSTGISVGTTTFALPSGTVGYWPFTNASNIGGDSSGQGNTLTTASGTPVHSEIGEFVGGSLYLDGNTSLNTLSGTFPSGIPTGASSYTIAVWEKAAAGCPDNGGFVGWGNNSGSQANNLRLNGVNSVNNYWFANDFTVSGLAVNPLDGNWHAIVVTWDGTTQKMYVDGINVGSRTPTSPNVQAANFIVGATTADVKFNGLMQNLLIVNRALNTAEVTNYQTGFVSLNPPEPATPVVWYKANAITGLTNNAKVATWGDSSGSGNNATETVSGNQPTYVTNAMSGLPVVRFNSANSTYMTFTRPISNNFTMTFVYQSSQGIGTGTQFYQGAGLVNGEVGGVTDDFGTSLNANGYILAGTGNPDTSLMSGSGLNDGRPHVVTFKRTQSSGALVLYIDGSQVSTGTGGTQSLAAPGQLTLGAQQTLNNYLSGDIAEVQIFKKALTDAERQALESGLISEYAIGLPSPWQSKDINASLLGGASYSNGVFTVLGSGSDIYNTADGFRFVYQSGSGDCSVVAKVNSVSNTDANAKGAVMIRETLAAGSTEAVAIVNPGGGVQFIWRSATGGSASATSSVGVSFPIWLKVTRSGNSFSGYYSSNGTTWTQMGTSQTISMATATEIGLAVTSHNTSSLCTAVFSNVTASP